MKKTIHFDFLQIILLFVLILLLEGISYSQWQPEMRLTNDPAESYLSGTNTRSIATFEGIQNIVWADLRDGNQEIYYKR